MKLPGMDGVETVRQMKRQRPEAKIVIFSGFGSEYISQAIEAGADGYLLKTVSPAELVEAVHQAARGESPIDPQLAPALLDRFAHLSRLTQHQGLSRRQYEILRLVAGGLPSKAIVAQMAISDATLKREIRAIFNYLGVNDRAHAVAEGYRRHLL
jgi:DNA-binding NarL/FixJ family response regulator